MKFKAFLNEARYEGTARSKGLTIDEASFLVNKNCKKSLKAFINRSEIFRGIRGAFGGDVCLFTDPTQSTRVSANTYNFYTLFIDNSPAWSDYPKRSKSIICTTSDQSAEGYGQIFVVLPYDNAKIGLCPAYDFWASFGKTIKNMDLSDFNGSLLRIFEYFNKSFDATNITYKELIDNINLVGKRAIEAFSLHWWGPPPAWVMTNKTLMDNLNEVLDPKKNKFKVIKPGQTLPRADHELWVGEAPSILVRYERIHEFLEAVKK